MSERFEDFVSGLSQAASATAAPGADAARRRARQRRTRQRLTASALSLVILGGAGGIAAAGLGHTGGSSVPPAHSSSAPVPTVSVSGSPAPLPSASESTGATPNPGLSPAVGTYHPGDWYDATDAPLSSSTIAWVPVSDLLGSRIGGNVFQIARSDSGLTELSFFGDGCSVGSLTSGASAAQYEYYTGYDDNSFLNNADVAIAASVTHKVYFYADAGSAAAAWNGIASGFAACAKAETGTNPTTGNDITGHATKTTSASDVQCWSNVTTPTSKPAGGGTSDHVCLVRRGEQIAAVDVSVNFSKSAYLSTVDYGAFDTLLRHDVEAGLSGELNSGSLPVCGDGDLIITLGPSGTYSTSNGKYRVLIVTNISGSTCTVDGYPAAMLVDGSGKIKNNAANDMQDPNDAKVYSEARVTLAPNATGSAILTWSSVSDVGNCMYSGTYSLEVSAPQSSTTTHLGTLTKVCETLSIMPLQPKLVTP